MTDLSLASWEDIQLEISKRFPLWAVVIVHPVEGDLRNVVTRAAWGCNGDHALLVGKVELMKLSIASAVLQQQAPINPFSQPLDPPMGGPGQGPGPNPEEGREPWRG